MEAVSLTFKAGCFVLSLVLLKRLIRRLGRSRGGQLPPGPPGYPIIGNALEWPVTQPWKTLTKWAEHYGEGFIFVPEPVRFTSCGLGDIYRATILGQEAIVINSVEIANALLIQRAQSYSHRPHMVFGGDLVGWKDLMTLLDDGPQHKEQRRLVAQEMGTRAALGQFSPMMETKTREFICAVLDEPSPEALLSHIRA
jgi:cytochrome P450